MGCCLYHTFLLGVTRGWLWGTCWDVGLQEPGVVSYAAATSACEKRRRWEVEEGRSFGVSPCSQELHLAREVRCCSGGVPARAGAGGPVQFARRGLRSKCTNCRLQLPLPLGTRYFNPTTHQFSGFGRSPERCPARKPCQCL